MEKTEKKKSKMEWVIITILLIYLAGMAIGLFSGTP